MKIYEIGTGYTPIPAQIAAATESVVEELTKAFIEMAVDVEIIDIYTSNRASHNLPIMEVKVPKVLASSDVSLGIIHKLKRVSYSVALAFKIKKLLKNTDEKVFLHFHNQYNMFFYVKLVSKRLRKRAIAIYTNHNGVWSMPWEEAEPILKKRYFQEIVALKEADISFVLNAKTKENIEKQLGVLPNRVIQVANGVNTDVYCPLPKDSVDAVKAKFDLAGKKVILQAGSINENKGQARALKLLAPLLRENADLVFAYVGEIVSQDYFDEVENCAKELGVTGQVRYLGAVSPGGEMNMLYNIACATVFSSQYEGFPLVCVESLSAGVPVLACSRVSLDLGEGFILCTEADFARKVSNGILVEDVLAQVSQSARENV